jgi:predicted nucleotidyltransferase
MELLTRREFADYLTLAGEPETTFSRLRERLGLTVPMLKFEIHRMKRAGCLVALGRGRYRFVRPELWVSAVQVHDRFPELLEHPEILALEGVLGIYAYGSWVRGEASEHSDRDLLVLVRDLSCVDLVRRPPPKIDIKVVGFEEAVKLIRKDPILIVPILRECFPIYGGELLEYLRSLRFSRERLMASLWEALASVSLAEEILKATEGDEVDSTLLYPIVLRFRQYCLVRSTLEGIPQTLKQAERIAEEHGINRREFWEIYEAFRLERGGVQTKLSKGKVARFLRVVKKLLEEYLEKHRPKRIVTDRMRRLEELQREFEGIKHVTKKETA